MHDAGYKIHRRMTQGAPREYLMHIRREYSKADLRACEYLELHAPEWSGGVFSTNGPIELMLNKKARKGHIASIYLGHCVVSSYLRTVIGHASLRRVLFRETRLTDGFNPIMRMSYSWEEVGGEPWWQITSDLVLPRLSPGSVFIDTYGEPYVEGQSIGCHLVEGFYFYPERHYRRSDLAQVGAFDVALTHERFGVGPQNSHRALIISQKVYRLFVEHKVKAGYVPVRVDED